MPRQDAATRRAISLFMVILGGFDSTNKDTKNIFLLFLQKKFADMLFVCTFAVY
jgi:hypothetical protein